MDACTLTLALALSSHIGLVRDYNEVHPAIKCDRDNTGIIAGAYLNSEDRVSAYAGVKFAGEGPLWAEVGIVSGYTSHEVLPMLRVGADLGRGTSIFAAPAIEVWNGETTVGGVIGIEIKLGGN